MVGRAVRGLSKRPYVFTKCSLVWDGSGARAVAVAPITSLQPPYSLLATEVEHSIFHFTMRQQIGVIVYSPMASGLLSGAMTRERIAARPEDDWRKRSANFREPALTSNLRLLEALRAIGQRYNSTPGAVAIAWTLRNPAVTGAIVDIRRAQRVDGVIVAAEMELDSTDLLEIEQTMPLQVA